MKKITKRDGRVATFNPDKISMAVKKAATAVGQNMSEEELERITDEVVSMVDNNFTTKKRPSVEDVQDCVEKVLTSNNLYEVVKAYIIYRNERTWSRNTHSDFIKLMGELTFSDSSEVDLKRENANIDGDTAMGTMLRYGSEASKYFTEAKVLDKDVAAAHHNGEIHIHDMDFHNFTATCCQIDLSKLFKNGFSTGHGFLRTPNGIGSYSALACIALQANQNEMHGGQSIPALDYYLAPGVAKSFISRFHEILSIYIDLDDSDTALLTDVKEQMKNYVKAHTLIMNKDGEDFVKTLVCTENELISEVVFEKCWNKACKMTDKDTFQAMEALIHNLNTMHSRAGAQVPFSSVNFGTDVSTEGRLVTKNLLLATDAGLGNGETPIFPISIFKVKEGINYNVGDPNYDLFKLACKVSSKRLFPNFSFLDAPFNAKYYKEGNVDTEIAYMGCRTRVISNVNDPSREIVTGRGNISFTSINLPRLGIKAKGDLDKFFESLKEELDLVVRQLNKRFEIQSQRKVKNFPFLMGQGVWIDSDKLNPEDTLEKVLRHGSLSMGFIGLAETLVALTGKHHGESKDSQELGLKIIGFMRDYADKLAEKTGLNFSILATPAEGLAGRFVRMDKKAFGIIPGVTDKDWYTNSFHVPVEYQVSAFEKIKLEAPYHALTNAGHISYIEMDGDPTNNIEAFEAVIRCMKESGIGYGAVNHPVDRDPICGYSGIIGEECPLCGRKSGEKVSASHVEAVTGHKVNYYVDEDGNVGEGIGIERIRRVTGYLVGTLDRFNDAKKAEVEHRTKHA